MDALGVIYTKLKALQIPVYRINSDRAREFVGARFRKWCSMRGIEQTTAAGDEPSGNARVEQEVGAIKRATRVLLRSAGLGEEQWPLVLRHAAELRFRSQLERFGLRMPNLIPFGTKVLVKRKTWQKRGEAWRYPTQQALVLGPASDMSPTANAHWVQLELKTEPHSGQRLQ